jgi:dihydrofolate reductase
MKCSVFVATSLDGYIARKDGNIDWLNEANTVVPAGTDLGFDAFLSSVDVLIVGRKTFEQVLSFNEWPYGATPVVVMSRSLEKTPVNAPSTVSLSAEPPRQLLSRLSAAGYQHAYVDGGLTIQSFLAENLIDETTITVLPILLGSGIPLFGETQRDIHLKLVASKAYDFGFIQNKYCMVDQ